MPKLVHLSDIHVGLKLLLDEDYDRDAVLFETIKAHHAKDTILITGDLVDNGYKWEYERLDTLLGGVKNIVAAPGNHDYGTLGCAYSVDARHRFAERFGVPDEPYPHVKKIMRGKVELIVLDSDARNRELLARGRIHKRQLKRLHEHLSTPTKSKRVLILHHHPWDRKLGEELIDAKEFCKVIKNRVDLMLFGHHHKAAKWENRLGIPWIAAAPKTPDAGYFHTYEWDENGKLQVEKVKFR